MDALLHCGFYNYILTENIQAILDARHPAVRTYIKNAKASNPQCVVDLTRGRKRLSAILLDDGLICLSALPTKRLANRLGLKTDEQDKADEDTGSRNPV